MSFSQPVFRFAPSPNGLLHLGHARSALLGFGMARAAGGRFLIRIEDIDTIRCSPEFEVGILRDLDRLGVVSDGPIRRQSEHFAEYADALDRLKAMGLVYPSFLSRADIRRAVAELEAGGQAWPRDPDGAALYPGDERDLDLGDAAARIGAGEQVLWRLDMARAVEQAGSLSWQESGDEAGDTNADRRALEGGRDFRSIPADPTVWGDVVVARADVPTSYHVSVVVDDALQGVTDVVRGADLFHATAVHRLLQQLLGLPEPRYHHHALVRDAAGRKLSKSDGDMGLSVLLDRGVEAREIGMLVNLPVSSDFG